MGGAEVQLSKWTSQRLLEHDIKDAKPLPSSNRLRKDLDETFEAHEQKISMTSSLECGGGKTSKQQLVED